jgi:hypothetical protein
MMEIWLYRVIQKGEQILLQLLAPGLEIRICNCWLHSRCCLQYTTIYRFCKTIPLMGVLNNYEMALTYIIALSVLSFFSFLVATISLTKWLRTWELRSLAGFQVFYSLVPINSILLCVTIIANPVSCLAACIVSLILLSDVGSAGKAALLGMLAVVPSWEYVCASLNGSHIITRMQIEILEIQRLYASYKIRLSRMPWQDTKWHAVPFLLLRGLLVGQFACYAILFTQKSEGLRSIQILLILQTLFWLVCHNWLVWKLWPDLKVPWLNVLDSRRIFMAIPGLCISPENILNSYNLCLITVSNASTSLHPLTHTRLAYSLIISYSWYCRTLPAA